MSKPQRGSGKVEGSHRRSTAITITSALTHSPRLTEVDRHEQALASAQEATDHYRQLAETAPDAHLPDLAAALHILADCLDDVGRHEQALASVEEATDHYRRLAEAAPAAYLPDLAGSLRKLAYSLAGVGRSEQALASAQEVATICRRLAETAP